jgi:hypothetical protein
MNYDRLARTISWFLKYALIPMLPLIVSLILNFIFLKGEISLNLINPGLLAFFVVIICFTIAFQSQNLTPPRPRASYNLLCFYFFFGAVFIILCAVTNLFTSLEQSFFEKIIWCINNIQNSEIMLMNSNDWVHYQDIIQQHSEIVDYDTYAKTLIYFFSVPVVAFSVFFSHIYELGEV